MAAKENITITLNRLRKSIAVKVPIIVNTNSSCLKGLVQALEHEKLITVLKVYKDSCVVKVTTGITTIEVLPHFQQTKKSQLAVWRQKFLPRGKGHLIISTNKGMMSDSTAEQKQLGGQIVGFVY